MRAPESEDELTSKTVSKDAGRQYTAEELEYAPFHEPDFSKLTSVRLTIQALFAVLRESGFVLGAFEMEKVYDWDHESWTNAIHAILDPLAVLVGTVKRKTTSTPAHKAGTRVVLPPPSYASSEDSDSSVKSPRRMPMRRPPRVMQLAATPAGPETPSTVGRIPKALRRECKLHPGRRRPLRATRARRPTTTETVPQESTDVAMESVSSRSSSRSKRDQDEDPDDLFDLDAGLTGTAAAVSTATAGAGVARVRLSAFSELKEFNRKDASEEKSRAWFNRLKSASRRDGMSGDDVCAMFGDLIAGPAQEKREHVELFINTLGAQEQELASRLTLMEVPDTATLVKKLRARQRGLAHQKKTLFGS
ncbi:Eukaryotic/viral aspartic protease, partial [Phytophthora megakarya]